jgi:hypothetical protein
MSSGRRRAVLEEFAFGDRPDVNPAQRLKAFAYRGTVGKFTGFPFAIGLKQRSACIPMQVWVEGREVPLRRVVPVGRGSC